MLNTAAEIVSWVLIAGANLPWCGDIKDVIAFRRGAREMGLFPGSDSDAVRFRTFWATSAMYVSLDGASFFVNPYVRIALAAVLASFMRLLAPLAYSVIRNKIQANVRTLYGRIGVANPSGEHLAATYWQLLKLYLMITATTSKDREHLIGINFHKLVDEIGRQYLIADVRSKAPQDPFGT